MQHFLHTFAKALLDRAERHDQSKLAAPEVQLFTEFTPKLAGSTYGSPEYEGFRKAMGAALQHHYAKNRHHPEHWPTPTGPEIDQLRADLRALAVVRSEDDRACDDALARVTARLRADLAAMESSVNGMNLIDLVEMFCDWKAATERHHDGNIRKSIDTNQERFGISHQLARAFQNTVEVVEG